MLVMDRTLALLTLVTALIACGESVVTSTTSAGGSTSVGAGGAGVGGRGGGGVGGQADPTVCGDACLECCNDPACPADKPSEGEPCTMPLECGYVDDAGCIEGWDCIHDQADSSSPSSWVKRDVVACPGEGCPPDFIDLLDPVLCFEGTSCVYQVVVHGDDLGCINYICEADHHWGGEPLGDNCP